MAEGGIVRPSAVAESIYRREILPWGLLGLALGLVEGATAAVLVKQHFAGVAPRFVVNLAVGLVSGAPAFANVLSFVWANLAHGRARVRLMVALQAVFSLLVGCVSFASRAATGLLLTVVAIICARVVWGGILTVRAAVWTANYPRNVLARITGRIVIVNAIAVAISAALVGWALEAHVIDGMLAWEPYVTSAAVDGDRVLVRFTNLGLLASNIVTTKQYARLDPGALTRYLAAWYDAAQWWNKNPADATKLAATFESKRSGVRVAPIVYEATLKYVSTDPLFLVTHTQDFYDDLKQTATEDVQGHHLDAVPDFSGLIDVSYLEKAVELSTTQHR